MAQYEPARRLQIRLAAEAIQVGIALGFKLEMIRGLSADKWLAAAAGNTAMIDEETRACSRGCVNGRKAVARALLRT